MSSLLVTVQGKEHIVEVEDGRCELQGNPDASAVEIAPGIFSVIVDGVSVRVLAYRQGESYTAHCAGVVGEVLVETERSRLLKRYAGVGSVLTRKAEIYAPMPALIVKVEVQAGDAVEKGQGLVILEAMKMENELKAPQAGIVKTVLVEKGTKVEKGELMLLLE
jgi:biotin carboxyl carrier protein